MSHISENRSIIKTVHGALLQETLELLAQQEAGMTVSTAIKDYGMNDLKVDCAVYTPHLKRGIGLNWKKDGQLTWKGDDWGAGQEYRRIQELIVKTYQALAVQKSLTFMGYAVNTQVTDTGNLRVEAVHA